MDWRELDRELAEWAYGLALPDAPLQIVTHVATKGGVWLLVALAFVIVGRGATRRAGAALIAGLLLHLVLLETLLKNAIARPRPCETLRLAIRDTVVDASTFSFPSGHSAASFLAAWVIGARFPLWRIPLLTLAALVAFSRVALGAHYPTDVAGGAVFGLMLGTFMARIFRVEEHSVGIEAAPPGAPDEQVPDGAA